MEMRERIKAIRTHKNVNLTQAEFSVALGLAPTSAASWEKKANPQIPTESMRLLICQKFGVNREWLETGKEPMFLEKPKAIAAAELTDDPMIRAILEAYLDLDPQARQMFRKYFADVVARYKGEQPASTPDAIVDHARATEPPDSFVRSKRIPVIQGTHEAEIQMQYQAKQERRELAQPEAIQSDSP